MGSIVDWDIKSLWTSDAIWQDRWWHRSWLILAQIMASCLMAQSHCLNQMLTSHSWGSVAFTWEQFHSECPCYYFVQWVWKLLLKLLSHLPGFNELIMHWNWRLIHHTIIARNKHCCCWIMYDQVLLHDDDKSAILSTVADYLCDKPTGAPFTKLTWINFNPSMDM